MQIEELAVPDAFVATPVVHEDDRGGFLEWFRADLAAAATGRRFDLAQANASVSAAGVIRGVHFADVPPGQAKWVTCLAGSVLDVVVDVRVGSPTYGRWDAVMLDDVDRRAVFVAEGLGHAFMALTDGSVAAYLCSSTYAPAREHGVDPLDPGLGIPWPTHGPDGQPLEPRLSDKDRAAPSLAQAAAEGVLPAYDEVRAYLDGLR